MKIGDKVENKAGEEFEILEVNSTETYPIIAERVKDKKNFSFTLEGKFYTGNSSNLDLIITEEVPCTNELSMFDSCYTLPSEPIFEEEILSSMGVNPYEASLKNAKVELSTEITGLIETNGDISEILSKLKILKKLLEL